ncbi:MAG: hypothetical protein HYV07_06385 [Deltaproteobacteria bacterium]|nr:hypothetical protein [Deltaproteobacteria bacterium]
MTQKLRLSASVDGDLLGAVEDAVARGRAATLSAWVNDALKRKLAEDRRLEALAEFVTAYEAENGEITPEEMRQATRRARSRAVNARALPERRSATPIRRSRGSR